MGQATACGDNASPGTSQKRWGSTYLPRFPLAYITEGNPGICRCRIRLLLKPGIRVLHATTASLIAEAVICAAEELRVAHMAFSRNRLICPWKPPHCR